MNKDQLSDRIVKEYTDFALQNDQSRYNVWLFCQYAEISEEEFYACYPSLHEVERGVWSMLMHAAIDTAEEDAGYEDFTAHQRLLSVLYTFFENLTLNRSFALLSLQGYHQLERLSLFSELRSTFLEYIDRTFRDAEVNPRIHPLSRNHFIKMKGFKEGFWLQLLGLISFWKNDGSRDFENTDAAIEKSMRVATELVAQVPKDSVMDLGRFLFKSITK